MDNQEQYTKRCNTCGETSPSNMNFCRYCGSRLEETIEMPAAKPEAFQTEIITEEKPITDDSRTVAPRSSSASILGKKPLGNGIKVFLSILSAVVPGFGQVLGLVFAIIFMNTEEDIDRQSFGGALLVGSLVMFLLTCIVAAILALTIYNPPVL